MRVSRQWCGDIVRYIANCQDVQSAEHWPQSVHERECGQSGEWDHRHWPQLHLQLAVQLHLRQERDGGSHRGDRHQSGPGGCAEQLSRGPQF